MGSGGVGEGQQRRVSAAVGGGRESDNRGCWRRLELGHHSIEQGLEEGDYGRKKMTLSRRMLIGWWTLID